jgi:hypothetical protein
VEVTSSGKYSLSVWGGADDGVEDCGCSSSYGRDVREGRQARDEKYATVIERQLGSEKVCSIVQ